MLGKLWDFIVDSSITFFLPLVCSYFAFHSSIFFNIACEEATGLEKLSNQIFAPCHYLFLGKSAKRSSDGGWEFQDRFDYTNNFWIKTLSSSLAAAPSFVAGTAAKTASLFQKDSRAHYREMSLALHSTEVKSNLPYYESLGIAIRGSSQPGEVIPQGYKRRPGDEEVLQYEKKALQDVTRLLAKANIPWWIDCGTCLGAYRYGGVIPWDEDVDVAVLRPDFDNVCRVLNQLDPMEYIVQDWSSRDFPKSCLKVYIRKSNTMIDIYHFDIHPEKRELAYVLSLENALFFPEWWKIRERRFKAPISYDDLFPLKKGTLDGIEVNMPQNTEKYLQRYYGENLAPAKIYSEATGQYEKDLNHPYWKRAYVH